LDPIQTASYSFPQDIVCCHPILLIDNLKISREDEEI